MVMPVETMLFLVAGLAHSQLAVSKADSKLRDIPDAFGCRAMGGKGPSSLTNCQHLY
jgi:hypothetical protein